MGGTILYAPGDVRCEERSDPTIIEPTDALADGNLVATPEQPADDLVPSLLALSDVMATGWHAAVSAGVQPGMTVAVVGDGAVGLSGVLRHRSSLRIR
jgi:hypothetical protein